MHADLRHRAARARWTLARAAPARPVPARGPRPGVRHRPRRRPPLRTPRHGRGVRGAAALRRSAPHRDPGIELFDHACELLEATSALRRAITDPGSTEVVPAVLGCV